MSQGHKGGGLVGGVTEHDALVTGSGVLDLGGVDGLSDVGGLLLDGNDHVTGLVVKALGDVVCYCS